MCFDVCVLFLFCLLTIYQIDSQRLLNEKADLLHAELSLAEQAEDYSKCEELEAKLKEIPKTIAEAKVANQRQKLEQGISREKEHLQSRAQGSEMILRMQRDLARTGGSEDHLASTGGGSDRHSQDRVLTRSQNRMPVSPTRSRKSANQNHYDSSSENGSERRYRTKNEPNRSQVRHLDFSLAQNFCLVIFLSLSPSLSLFKPCETVCSVLFYV